MILEIALGIVLAVIILAFLPQILAIGIFATVVAIGLGLIVLVGVFVFDNFKALPDLSANPKALIFIVGLLVIVVAWDVFIFSRESSNKKDGENRSSPENDSWKIEYVKNDPQLKQAATEEVDSASVARLHESKDSIEDGKNIYG